MAWIACAVGVHCLVDAFGALSHAVLRWPVWRLESLFAIASVAVPTSGAALARRPLACAAACNRAPDDAMNAPSGSNIE